MDKEIFGQKMDVRISLEDGKKTISVLPWPENHNEYMLFKKIMDEESLQILWNKSYFGINHRTQMFMVLYNTFVDTLNNKSTINDELTLQALYCDMILRLGTILEDFAGMCKACQEFNIHGTTIAGYFLAFSDPMSFYNSVSVKAHRQIKQIFNLPQSKGNLDQIFVDLSEEEKELVWKGIRFTTEIIQEYLTDISKAIRREINSNVTYYDMYNKLKHGFAPIYPFIMPSNFVISGIAEEDNEEEVIKKYMFEGINIMHDKIAGQRTHEEMERFKNLRLATPTITFDAVTIDAVNDMKDVVEKVEDLYKYLVNQYLLVAEGNNKLILKLREGMLTGDEENQLSAIIK